MTRLLDELEAEWDRIADDPVQLRKITPLGDLPGVGTLRQLEGWTSRAKPAEVNAVLLELARRAGAGDEFACGVLLRLLWPGVLVLTGRWQALGDIEERASAVVAAVFLRIRRYPCERRPRAVAANVLLDAEKDLRRQALHRVVEPIGLDPIGVDVPAVPPTTSATEELLHLLAHAVATKRLSRFEARLVGETRIAGRSLPDVGEGQHVRWLQRRRAAAEARLMRIGSAA